MASIVLERVPQIAHMVLGLVLVAMPTGCYQVHGAEGGACAAGSPCDCRAALPVPEGVGWVGANGSAYAAAPPYRHTIPRPFWLGTYDATAGCYRRCVESGWCSTPETEWVIGGGWQNATRFTPSAPSGHLPHQGEGPGGDNPAPRFAPSISVIPRGPRSGHPGDLGYPG